MVSALFSESNSCVFPVCKCRSGQVCQGVRVGLDETEALKERCRVESKERVMSNAEMA